MSQPEDQSKTGTLPDPELNPLLNPLLAANMGRWAEVYFTNPPEKRAQAVAELLRELEQNPQPEPHSARTQEKAQGSVENKAVDTLPRRPESSEPTIACASCGHTNQEGQRFCGMCGMPLPGSESAGELEPAEALVRQQSWHDQEQSRTKISARDNGILGPGSESAYSRGDLPSFASLSADSDDSGQLFEYESRPVRRHFRIYVGVALAIILGLLVYKTWRGNASFRVGHSAPAAPPQEAGNPAPAIQPSNPASAEPAAAESNSAGNAANAAASTPPTSEKVPPKATPRQPTIVGNPPATPANASPGSPVTDSGASELAVGEKYLHGNASTARDPQEAASWLWKAVAKQNPTATMLLSDMYLRGEGVSKSCDQARVLLDAAARKGNAAAAERLRNMPAFGCQ